MLSFKDKHGLKFCRQQEEEGLFPLKINFPKIKKKKSPKYFPSFFLTHWYPFLLPFYIEIEIYSKQHHLTDGVGDVRKGNVILRIYIVFVKCSFVLRSIPELFFY